MESNSEQTTQKIPVVVSCDENYARYAKVMFTSLLDHLEEGASCEIIVLYKNLSADSQKRLTDFAARKKNCTLRLLEIPEGFLAEHQFFTSGHITEAAYYRLFIADLLPEYDRVIYLDVDVIVEGNIRDLYRVKMGEHDLAAVLDVSFNRLNSAYAEEVLGIPKNCPCFNSGVLLMNLRRLRKAHMSKSFMEMNRKLGKPQFYVQDILNAVCFDRTLLLDDCWNFQFHEMRQPMEPSALQEQPKILHFTGREKPWMHPGHPNAQVWWKYCGKEAADELHHDPEAMSWAEKKYVLPEKVLQSLFGIGKHLCLFSELFKTYLKENPAAVENLCAILYDEPSRETVRLGMEHLLTVPAPKYVHAFFYQPAKLLTDGEKYDWVRHITAFPLYHSIFHHLFNFYEPTEFYYRHGMIWMTDSFLERLKGGIFIDCGAFDGASALVMSLYQPSYIYAFEPSKTNYQQCAENIRKGQIRANCTLIHSCNGNTDGTVQFSDNGQSDSAIGAGEAVPICKIDTFMQANKVPRLDWIKADLEGFALEMIRGAEQAVKQWKPLLTIGVYHCPDEFFTLPRLLKQWVPEYQFMYRRCQCRPELCYNEITLIAWVPAPGEEQQGLKNVDRYLGPF